MSSTTCSPCSLRRYGEPRRNPDFWRGVSPRTYFDRVSDPLLVHHGTADDTCPIEWSEDIVETLKEKGKDYEFHRYDGAGHAFFCADRAAYRPEQAVDGWKKVFEFYGRHLAAPIEDPSAAI